MPTFNNDAVLRAVLDGWQRFGGDDIELIVVEDGCRDGTPATSTRAATRRPGAASTCGGSTRTTRTSCGARTRLSRSRAAQLLMAWQDDMFLRCRWLVPELCATFARLSGIGLISLSRGLNCLPLDEPIETLGGSRRLAAAAEHDRRRRPATGSGCRKWTP